MKRMRQVLRNVRDERGFTLVELLMVMVIIGVLAGLGFMGMGMLQQRTLVTKADTNWRVLDSAVQMYRAENIDLPDGLLTVQDLSNYLDLSANSEDPWNDVAHSADNDRCVVPGPDSPKELIYCIDEGGGTHIWMTDGKRVGAASNNPKEYEYGTVAGETGGTGGS